MTLLSAIPVSRLSGPSADMSCHIIVDGLYTSQYMFIVKYRILYGRFSDHI
jgi:hypothetical protein